MAAEGDPGLFCIGDFSNQQQLTWLKRMAGANVTRKLAPAKFALVARGTGRASPRRYPRARPAMHLNLHVALTHEGH